MADVRRQTGHSTIEMVAASGIPTGVDGVQFFLCGSATSADRAEVTFGIRELLCQQLVEFIAAGELPGEIAAVRG